MQGLLSLDELAVEVGGGAVVLVEVITVNADDHQRAAVGWGEFGLMAARHRRSEPKGALVVGCGVKHKIRGRCFSCFGACSVATNSPKFHTQSWIQQRRLEKSES